MKRLLSLFVILLVSLDIQAVTKEIDYIQEGDRLPSFSVVDQCGDTIRSADLRGKLSLITFFHTRCYDCRRELPIVQELYVKYKSDLQFICISRAESFASIEKYWKQNGLTMPFAAQEDKNVFKLFAERIIPRIYLVDDNGVVQRTFKEKVRKKKLNKAILSLLKRN